VFAACSVVLAACSFELPVLEADLPPNAQSSVFYAADGTPIVTLHAEENRTDLTLDEIPPHVRDAVIAIEETRGRLEDALAAEAAASPGPGPGSASPAP